MKSLTRGQFLGAAAGTVGAGLLSGCESGPGIGGTGTGGGTAPDVIVHGRVIHTMDDANPTAESLAVRDGRFVAVGSRADIEQLRAPGTIVMDHGDAVITPGFIDAHTHPAGAGVRELEGRERGRPEHRRDQGSHGRAGSRDAARGVDPRLQVRRHQARRGRPLNRLDLDEAVPDHPAVVGQRRRAHQRVQLAGVCGGGRNGRDPRSPGREVLPRRRRATGLVAERANAAFSGLIPSTHTGRGPPGGGQTDHRTDGHGGLTSFPRRGHLVEQRGGVQRRIPGGRSELPRVHDDARSLHEPAPGGVSTGFGDEWLRVGGVKYGADGSASERTMRMSTPYVGRPDDYGILTMSQEEIHEAVEVAHRANWQVGIHANGDVTIDMVLNAYERVQELWPRPNPRHRIEHCSLVNPDLLARIKAAGAVPTPFYTLCALSREQVGRIRPREDGVDVPAPASSLDYDIPVAPASDYTPGPYEPLMAIQSMVTRKDFEGRVWGPSQRISVAEAMRICTSGWRLRVVRGGDQGVGDGGQAGGFRGAGGGPARHGSGRDQGDSGVEDGGGGTGYVGGVRGAIGAERAGSQLFAK